MRRRMFAALVALSFLSHCARKPTAIAESDEEPLVTPQPPEQVNCAVPEGMVAPLQPARGGDTVVVASFRQASKYSTTRRGDWDYSWFLVVYEVIRIERGSWIEDELVFATFDRHPTPGSNIMIRRGPWPFRKGTVYAFALDSTQACARIVGTEERSRIAPHGPLIRPNLAEVTLLKVVGAARQFLKKQEQFGGGGACILEEAGGGYVVEIRAESGSGVGTWLLVVDKETLAVEFLPEPTPKAKLRRCPNGHTTIKLVPIVYAITLHLSLALGGQPQRRE